MAPVGRHSAHRAETADTKARKLADDLRQLDPDDNGLRLLGNLPKIAGRKELDAALLPIAKEELLAVLTEYLRQFGTRSLREISQGLAQRRDDDHFCQPPGFCWR